MRRTDRRSPGIRFESRPPPLPDPLPRMDVTAFVGFAASGPLHVPVAVDDPRQFANVFGDDVALGWDGDAGQVVRGQLGPCVRAFFRNGGRRCWVVRVAGAARANRFAIPALARWQGGALVPACAVARCEGSWSDALAASAALDAQPIRLGRVELGAGGRLVSAQLLAPDQVAVGDVLRIALGGPPVVVAAIAGIDAGVARFGDGPPLWLTSAAPALPDPSGLAIAWFPGPTGDDGDDPVAQPLAPAGPPRLDGDALVVPVVAPPDGSTDAGALAPGRLVRLRWAGEELWLSVEDIVEVVAAGAGSPPGAAVELRGGWSRRLPGAVPGPAVLDGGALVAERLRISLWVARGTERPTRLDDLGLAPGQASYLGALPTDRALFAGDPRPAGGGGGGAGDGDGALGVLAEQLSRIAGNAADPREYYAALWQQVATPRFPLAIAAGADAFVPIAMPVVPGAYLGAQLPDGLAAARDGLAAFGPELFLDPDLADQAVDGLLAQADYVRWQASAPRRLTGIHAVLGIDEATLIAVPDAVQRGWTSAATVPPPVLAPPVVSAARADGDTWQLSWTAILASGGGDTTYAVEADASAAFTHPEVVWNGGATLVRLTGQPAGTRWFRVHAMQGAALGPWSNALALAFPPPQFQDCPDSVQMAPPVLTALAPDARGSIALAWTDVPGADRFTVEEVAGGDSVATVIYQGRDHELAVRGRPPGAYAYRVRAEQGHAAGAWSEPAVQVVPPPRQSLIVRAADFQPDAVLRPVHRAVLRMAAARGDLLAVLALPAQFRAPDATAHVAWLRAPAGEEPTWSYAALYHPWLVGDDDPGNGPVPTLPPDGAVCGMMAQRASLRGAWIAPANQPLRGAIELLPVVPRDDVDRFADAQVNLLRDEPHGILALSASTLARDPDLAQIHVRRLLILLRRIALRVGPGYVFEPSGAVFQRLVRRGFEAVLDDLFARGAFAGAERSAAYQLAVDASASVADQGRFVVEIKVAPSQPLSFLTVRLVQSGDLGVVTEAR